MVEGCILLELLAKSVAGLKENKVGCNVYVLLSSNADEVTPMQLVSNWAWNPLFFLAKKLDLALIDIVGECPALADCRTRRSPTP